MDFKLKFRGKRVFGSHKTIRGLVVGIIIATCIFSLQKNAVTNNENLANLGLFDYALAPLYYGLLMGAAAIFGDALKSFFKRQAGFEPGEPWFPFDQIDWIIGLLIVGSLFAQIDLLIVITSILVGTILHILSKAIGNIFNLQ